MIPIALNFEASGHFTVKDKLFDAIKSNLIYMSIMGTVGMVALFYLILKQYLSIFKISDFVISCANT